MNWFSVLNMLRNSHVDWVGISHGFNWFIPFTFFSDVEVENYIYS